MAKEKSNAGKRNRARGSKQPARTYEALINEITDAYETLGQRYQKIARYLMQNPNTVALKSVNMIGREGGVHASGLVRFAQHFGYSGFKELQSVFQARLATAAPGFRERIGALETDLQQKGRGGNLSLLHNLATRDIATLQELMASVTEESLTKAAALLKKAHTVFLVGQLRSEPIALFLRYVLTMLLKRVILLDAAGGLAAETAYVMTRDDVLIAIAFRHYAKETVTISEIAANRGTQIISITDSTLSPLAKHATVLFTVPEEEYTFSRSLAAPICLSQALAISLAALLQPTKGSPPRIPTVTELHRERR